MCDFVRGFAVWLDTCVKKFIFRTPLAFIMVCMSKILFEVVIKSVRLILKKKGKVEGAGVLLFRFKHIWANKRGGSGGL